MAPCCFCDELCASGVFTYESGKVIVCCPTCIAKLDDMHTILGGGAWWSVTGLEQMIEEKLAAEQGDGPIELDPLQVLQDVEALLGKPDD